MLKTIDLFAGAGGLSMGFEMTGKFDIVAAAEKNDNARQTYFANRDNDVLKIEDVRGFDFKKLAESLGGIDVVIGGPPCQGFSNANRQKNHIINQNNSLVKEYFRAIREIKPLAFVMENVSMLSSETHRFYDSRIDHDEIISLGIKMRNDELVIADGNYDGLNCLELLCSANYGQYRINSRIFQLLNILYKNRNNANRLKKFLEKNGRHLSILINEYLNNGGTDYEILHLISDNISNMEELGFLMKNLGMFIKYQKSFSLVDELNENQIIYSLYKNEETGKIMAKVNSYSVIDYVNKILGSSYNTSSGVINSLWFGVPQERRRFIMIGIRTDKCKGDIQFPKAESYQDIKQVTVNEAISDLAVYPVFDSLDEMKTIRYVNQDDLSEYEREMRKGSNGVNNHLVPKTRALALARFSALESGENFHKLSSELKKNYTDPGRTQNSIYQRLDPTKPSGTVTNVRKSMWIHPFINRAISVREAARLQSFPDKFMFIGTKDSQYQQVGNAVPPLMAKGIAECLLNSLK